ncbi:hypothetical protein KQ51_01593 [Candidatus Izimaplasma bacterium HR1]|jgi:tellurite resistance protein TehA-like permease|nr:hypothetical protein KQ51_01593 [Candidatus Izimaplasma bacterium HR1]
MRHVLFFLSQLATGTIGFVMFLEVFKDYLSEGFYYVIQKDIYSFFISILLLGLCVAIHIIYRKSNKKRRLR